MWDIDRDVPEGEPTDVTAEYTVRIGSTLGLELQVAAGRVGDVQRSRRIPPHDDLVSVDVQHPGLGVVGARRALPQRLAAPQVGDPRRPLGAGLGHVTSRR